MNTTFTEEYKNWIEKLSKENFDELIKNYVKEYYDTRNVYISNGPYDGGNDLIYEINGNKVKKNIQITVQNKGYEKKLDEDLIKSKVNIKEYSYLSNLDFYISQAITPEKKNKLIKDAEIKHQISLKIIDANELAGLAKEYKSISNTIFKFNKAAFPQEKTEIDNQIKILYDTLSMGRDITTIKNNFVQSLILTQLYNTPNITVGEIYNSLKSAFYNEYTKNFFETEIGRLKNNSKIIDIPNTFPKQYTLTEGMLNTLKEIEQNTQTHEAELINTFKQVLTRYNLENETGIIVSLVIELYNANYEIDEREIMLGANGQNQKIRQIFDKLILFLNKEKKIEKEVSNEIARQLLVICNKNEFLNKTSISKMFTNLFKSDKLESYLNTSRRNIYLDTQILLQTICYNYNDSEYDDQLYKTVKYFIQTVQSSQIPIELKTTIGYIEEVAWHIYNGLMLERFLDLDFIKDLGPSKNVFFNFYLELRDKEGITFESFSDFIEELLDVEVENYRFKPESFIEEVISNLVERLDYLGISVETPKLFEKEKYEKYRKQYEISLSYLKHDQKSFGARKNDLNTILHLSDIHYDMEENSFKEPYLITWDSSFYQVRKDFKKFKELNHWYLYPPMKFANTISVMNMKIDSKAINYNIISLTEENFNLSNDSISFLDILNGLCTLKDANKWTLASKLSKLRKQLIEEASMNDFGHKKSSNLPIDEFLLMIQTFYQNPSNKKNFSDLVRLFGNNEFADRISKLIEKNLKDFQEHNEIKHHIVEEIDKMILENNEEFNNSNN